MELAICCEFLMNREEYNEFPCWNVLLFDNFRFIIRTFKQICPKIHFLTEFVSNLRSWKIKTKNAINGQSHNDFIHEQSMRLHQNSDFNLQKQKVGIFQKSHDAKFLVSFESLSLIYTILDGFIAIS